MNLIWERAKNTWNFYTVNFIFRWKLRSLKTSFGKRFLQKFANSDPKVALITFSGPNLLAKMAHFFLISAPGQILARIQKCFSSSTFPGSIGNEERSCWLVLEWKFREVKNLKNVKKPSLVLVLKESAKRKKKWNSGKHKAKRPEGQGGLNAWLKYFCSHEEDRKWLKMLKFEHN